MNYLSIEGTVRMFGSTDNGGKGLLKLQLADVLRTSERESYTFMALLGDFGGFNDGISLLPAFIMTFYNQRLFRTAKA